MDTDKKLPTWAVITIIMIITLSILAIVMGLFFMSNVETQNEHDFRMACIQAHGTWTQNVCVVD